MIQHKSKINPTSVEILLKQFQDDRESYEKILLVLDFLNTNSNVFIDSGQSFIDLEWRVETKLFTRFRREVNLDTNILLDMHVQSNNLKKTKSTRTMKINPSNLKHIIHKLEQASVNSKNIHRLRK